MKKISLFTGFIIMLLIYSCKSETPFSPIPSANPWKDNYMDISQLKDFKKWGTYNVHDPAGKKIEDYYYIYSTDAIFSPHRRETGDSAIEVGNIQVRRSRDLVNWEFVGWAFDEIPKEAVNWVKDHTGGRGATNIWAPYLISYKDMYRLYYCVSAFGRKTSYIGLAESNSPEGPWQQKGVVVKTNDESVMNAIDPSVIVDTETGKWWMHYGSFFGGLFCVELNPETGLTMQEGDQGHLIARRANYQHDNLEAPEIIYNPERKEYYLFTSYDPLMTTYNIRVARSKNPEGPFTDFNGQDIKDTTNNFPILTAPYQFQNHTGWAGTGHCGVIESGDGRYFMLHQARLSPDNHQMVLHVREIFFNSDGWPVASPQRYAGTLQRTFGKKDLTGEWEIIRVMEPLHERQLEAGQILHGEGSLVEEEWNRSLHLTFFENGVIENMGSWEFLPDKQILKIKLDKEDLKELIIFAGQDWENEMETILFTGLDNRGRTIWGKRVK